MPRQVQPSGENKFIKGLITEATALQFPTDACTETWDCVFDETGRVTRREGFDQEVDSRAAMITTATTDAVNEFLWKTVAGNGDTQFLVQQFGSILHFYDVSDSNTISHHKLPFTVDLTDYIPADSNLTPPSFPCQFASGNGDLIVVNRAIDPIYVAYDPDANSITATAISINIRDFRGLFDGLEDGERPTDTVANIVTANPAHYYNMLNQSWAIGDALTQWDTARTDLPSNRDIMGVYRSTASDSFDNAIVTSYTGSNTLAPKGHFVLNAFGPDRVTALTDEGFSTVDFGETVFIQSQIPQDEGTVFGQAPNYSGTNAVLFNTVTSSSPELYHLSGNHYAGKNYSGGKAISKVVCYGSNNAGFAQRYLFSNGSYFFFTSDVSGVPPIITLYLYAKNGVPANGTDGTLLGSTSFSDSANESGGRTITSNDNTTTYTHVWVYMTVAIQIPDSTSPVCTPVEYEFFQAVETDVASSDDIFTYERPTTTEFYAGRAWYAGLSVAGINGNIYFSQIIERPTQYGRCYQKNDPTEEEFFDLLADDGGYISIPDAGQIVRIFAYQQALLVLATNGVWVIQGSGNGPFLATDYEVKKISSSGTASPLSVTSYRAVPFWWGYEGLFTITFDPNYGSFVVTSVSDQTIRSFINSIPAANKAYVKGASNSEDSVLYWIYNGNDPLATEDRYKYNRVLAMNMLSGALYPWTIGDEGDMDVRGICWIPSISPAALSVVKYTLTDNVATTYNSLTYGEPNNESYLDWERYSEDVEDFITLTSLTKFEDLTSNESAVFDGDQEAAASAGTKTSATSLYWGVTLSAASRIGRALVWPSSDQGFVTGANPQVTISLYGKTGSAPASGTDGTLLGSLTITDTTGTTDYYDIPSTSRSASWDHVWVNVAQSGSAATMYLSEVRFTAVADDATQDQDYSSEFTTGYRLDGDAFRFFQSNYVFVYLEQEDDASCMLNAVWDFTTSGSSGKWSTSQQIYNSALVFRGINHRRLKVRGKGKSLQLRFVSETGKPFTIIGWSIWQTANASV